MGGTYRGGLDGGIPSNRIGAILNDLIIYDIIPLYNKKTSLRGLKCLILLINNI